MFCYPETLYSLKRRPNRQLRKEREMWNQGNGNGPQDTYDRLNNTREVGGARFPFIEDGTHKLALCSLEEFQHQSDGPSARALFEVLASTNAAKHPVGSFAVKIWKLVKPPKFKDSLSDAELFADFCLKLKGAPRGYAIGNDIRVLMRERAAEQLARGTVIECTGVMNKKGKWVNVYWTSVLQTPEQIAQMRQRLEGRGIPPTSGGSMPTQGSYVSTPAPQSYPQVSGAPIVAPQGGGFLAGATQNSGDKPKW